MPNDVQYLLLVVSIVLLSAGQITQKLAARKLRSSEGAIAAVTSLLRNAWFWVSGSLLALAMVTWLLTLSQFEVSKAYPMLAASFVLTAIASRILLQEQIGRTQWAGIALITTGVALMLQTAG